jgi:hypothetical protein
MYDILRSQPKILKLTEKALSRTLDPREFPFAGDEKTAKESTRNNAKWAKNDDDIN